MKTIEWSDRPSDCGRFNFRVGRVGGRVCFTAAPQRYDGEGGWLLRDFLLGDNETSVASIAEMERRAQDRIAETIWLLEADGPAATKSLREVITAIEAGEKLHGRHGKSYRQEFGEAFLLRLKEAAG